MTETTIIFRALWCMLGLCGPPDAVGVGAFYSEGLMRRVCEYRVSEGWQDLDCSWPCLVSAIEPGHLGEMWLVYHESLSYHLCLTVDVGARRHLPALRARGEVVELPHWLAVGVGGWDGYVDNVRIWRLER